MAAAVLGQGGTSGAKQNRAWEEPRAEGSDSALLARPAGPTPHTSRQRPSSGGGPPAGNHRRHRAMRPPHNDDDGDSGMAEEGRRPSRGPAHMGARPVGGRMSSKQNLAEKLGSPPCLLPRIRKLTRSCQRHRVSCRTRAVPTDTKGSTGDQLHNHNHRRVGHDPPPCIHSSTSQAPRRNDRTGGNGGTLFWVQKEAQWSRTYQEPPTPRSLQTAQNRGGTGETAGNTLRISEQSVALKNNCFSRRRAHSHPSTCSTFYQSCDRFRNDPLPPHPHPVQKANRTEKPKARLGRLGRHDKHRSKVSSQQQKILKMHQTGSSCRGSVVSETDEEP